MSIVTRPAAAEHVVAIKAVLTAALPAQVAVLSWQDALNRPDDLPARYVLVQTSRRYVEPKRLDTTDTATSYRLSLRWVADLEDNADRLADQCNAAVEYTALVVGARRSTPIQHETTDPVRPDDGMWSGAGNYTYRL